MDWNQEIISENQRLRLPLLEEAGVEVFVKREDLIHPEVSGNKWRKLRYHMLEVMQHSEYEGFITKGGAYSNHILATASACCQSGFKSVAFVRGERIEPLNATLKKAEELGMKFLFISRADYRKSIKDLKSDHKIIGKWMDVPEGGSDDLGVKGCEEILAKKDKSDFNIVCTALGTGGTAAGLLRSKKSNQELWIFPALRGMDIEKTLRPWIDERQWQKGLVTVQSDYHFGGYAKLNEDLITFIRDFEKETGIPLDPVYTAKMMFGLMDLIKKEKITRGKRILAIHTGGLQGRAGMEERLGLDFSLI
jgi:1-aminocyclopropane-1-carboxylate deaminase